MKQVPLVCAVASRKDLFRADLILDFSISIPSTVSFGGVKGTRLGEKVGNHNLAQKVSKAA